ncbi:HlyD family efflux transporter periplasmic adaptor subunit [Anaerolentibacter hominis]|uniref:HlyD family efflux transporter periplasmic adaptor subunit n=1 Tax=Anaerolentibacter hominis TaxID=3079009 RepID=UPI0031B80790
MRRNSQKVVKYRKPIRINIGAVIFLIIFIYLIVNVVIYMGKDHIAIYEVLEKKIADDNRVTGIALRSEKVYKTERAGYINYFYREGSRIAKSSKVYAVDESGKIYDALASMDYNSKLTEEEIAGIRSDISDYRTNYTDSGYYNLYDFKSSMNNRVLDIANTSMMDQLDDYLENSGNAGSFYTVAAAKSGIISYIVDGMENLKKDDITAASFDKEAYQAAAHSVRTTEAVAVDSPAYKLITDENWSVVVPLTEEQYKNLEDKTTVRITFTKDNVSANAGLELFEKEGAYYAELSLNRYVVRYTEDRFIEVELNINSAQGLKIPVTSVTDKKFYLVPSDYIATDDNGNTGVLTEVYDQDTGAASTEFIQTEIFDINEETSMAYIDTTYIEAGKWVIHPESGEKFQVNQSDSLQGAFNVNKGYYVFRQVEILYQNEEYYIVRDDTPYGLSAYDHIVVDAQMANEDSFIY